MEMILIIPVVSSAITIITHTHDISVDNKDSSLN